MVILSIKKIENEIIKKSITTKQFVIYSFFTISPIFLLRYPINMEGFSIALFLATIPTMINIIKYISCYMEIRNKNIFLYLYSIIPVSFILNLRYSLFLTLPLIIINHYLIKYFNLDYDYWKTINIQIIRIISEFFIFINFIIIIKRLYKKIDIK